MKSREEARGDDYPEHLEHSNTDTQATAPDWKVWIKYRVSQKKRSLVVFKVL